MPAIVTMATMRSRARAMADMQTSNQAAAFVTDAELDQLLHRNLRALYQKLIVARGDEYYAKSVAIPSVANQAQYSFFDPTLDDFMSALNLMVSDGTRTIPVPKFNLKELADLLYLENLTSDDMGLFRYRLIGQNLEIRPKPRRAGYTFTLHYLPRYSEFVVDTNGFDGVNGWEDWACYGAAIDMLNKEESFEQAQALMAQRAILDAQIDALAGSRDAGMPEVVGDTLRDWNDMGVSYRRNDWRW